MDFKECDFRKCLMSLKLPRGCIYKRLSDATVYVSMLQIQIRYRDIVVVFSGENVLCAMLLFDDKFIMFCDDALSDDVIACLSEFLYTVWPSPDLHVLSDQDVKCYMSLAKKLEVNLDE